MALNEDKIENVIKTLLERSKKQNNEYLLFGNLYVYIRDNLPGHIELEEVFQFIYSRVPQHLFAEIDAKWKELTLKLLSLTRILIHIFIKRLDTQS